MILTRRHVGEVASMVEAALLSQICSINLHNRKCVVAAARINPVPKIPSYAKTSGVSVLLQSAFLPEAACNSAEFLQGKTSQKNT